MAREDLTPSEKLLFDNPNIKSEPTVYSSECYICNDPDFAQMGLPLCFSCSECGGHCAADDPACDDCGKKQ